MTGCQRFPMTGGQRFQGIQEVGVAQRAARHLSAFRPRQPVLGTWPLEVTDGREGPRQRNGPGKRGRPPGKAGATAGGTHPSGEGRGEERGREAGGSIPNDETSRTRMADRPASNIAEQSGTEFLTGSSESLRATEPSVVSSVGSVANALAITAGKAVLDALAALGAEQDVVRLSQVAEKTQLGADVLLPLERRLEGINLIEVINRTSFGDDSLKLTADGVDAASGHHLERLAALADE